MSYIGKIGNSISTKSKELVRKAKDASEVSSLNSIIKNENQKIELNYKMIGKLYFEKYGDAPDNEFVEAVGAINESMSKIAQTQEMIKKIKAKSCCPNCMTPFKSGSAFCSKCGTKLEISEPEVVCLNCKSKLTADAVFCDNCGTKVGSDAPVESEVSEDEAVEAEAVEAEVVETEVVEDEVVEAEIVEDEVAEDEDEQPGMAVTVSNRKCSSCGAEADDELAVFCNNCGTKL